MRISTNTPVIRLAERPVRSALRSLIRNTNGGRASCVVPEAHCGGAVPVLRPAISTHSGDMGVAPSLAGPKPQRVFTPLENDQTPTISLSSLPLLLSPSLSLPRTQQLPVPSSGKTARRTRSLSLFSAKRSCSVHEAEPSPVRGISS